MLFHRAVNNGLLDTYQLKSLDGVLESALNDMALVRKGDKLHFTPDGLDQQADADAYDNSALREPYDVVIRALGFTFDETIFK